MNKIEKEIWNKAIDKACKEIKKYDGIIPNEIDRDYMVTCIKNKLNKKEKL